MAPRRTIVMDMISYLVRPSNFLALLSALLIITVITAIVVYRVTGDVPEPLMSIVRIMFALPLVYMALVALLLSLTGNQPEAESDADESTPEE
jgi:hypothetical protein